MNDIKALLTLDWAAVILGIFIIMSGGIAIVTIIGKFSEIIGKPVKWVRNKQQDHELLMKTIQDLKELHDKHEEDTKESIKHDKAIENKLETLTDLFVNWEISSMRWEINNFATKISENKPCNKDCFQHCFKTYEAYEGILKERHLTNGEVEISMKIIRDAYQRKMQNGEF